MLTATDILECADLGSPEKVEIPEWNDHVYVRIMSGAERDQWEILTTTLIKNPEIINVRAALCAMTICDKSGQRLFTNDQIEKLGEKSAIPLDRVFAVAKRINKLSEEDIEELEKNS